VPMPYSALSHLDCPRCGTSYDADRVQGTCSCGSPLLTRYDLPQVARQVSPREIAGRPADLWRYHELLPVREAAHVVSLGEGMTPLLPMPRIGQALGVPGLLMKDEGVLPTGTFKARGAAVGVSRAAELGVTAIAMPTNGNAGAAWSVYAARAGMRSLIVMPAAAPPVTRAECAAAGAELYLTSGTIGDAGQLVADALQERPGYQNAATLREPYRIEGKKTMGLEIAEQLGWRIPGVIVYPAGGGVGIIGIYKALRELLELGWVTGDLPRLVAVQPEGCAPIVRAFQAGAAESQPWPDPKTVAFGLTVPKALGDFLILEALYATGGTAVAVTDEALLADQRAVARLEGSLICPEGAACFTAVRHLRASGWLTETDQVVVLNTGTGLIYPDTMATYPPLLPLPGPIPPLSQPRPDAMARGLRRALPSPRIAPSSPRQPAASATRSPAPPAPSASNTRAPRVRIPRRRSTHVQHGRSGIIRNRAARLPRWPSKSSNQQECGRAGMNHPAGDDRSRRPRCAGRGATRCRPSWGWPGRRCRRWPGSGPRSRAGCWWRRPTGRRCRSCGGCRCRR
jgi:threonine synthase